MTSSFEEGADEANATVTRGHAHIRFDATVGDYRICDDCSEYGTRIFRDGRSIAGGQAEAASRKLGTAAGARSVGFKELISLPASFGVTHREGVSFSYKKRPNLHDTSASGSQVGVEPRECVRKLALLRY